MTAESLGDADPWSRYSRRDFDHSPMIVFYEVTQACDLVCLHCRACAQARPHPQELSPTQSCCLIDQLARFPKPPHLVLTGGDPLKRSDVFSLIRHAIARGLEVSITPSATPLVTRQAVEKLRDAGICRMALSLDGADAATHDALRGVPGSFRRTLEILAAARDAGISLQVNTTVTSANSRQIESLAELLSREGITLWSVFFLVPTGRATGLAGLDSEAFEEVFAQLWRQSRRCPFAIKTTEAPHYRRFLVQQQRALPAEARRSLPRRAQLGCNDGKGILFVSHLGMVYPSGFLPICCGTFPQDDVVQVYQQSPLFQSLRDGDRLEGKCGRCEFRHLCGGSRARAYALTSNPLAEEPCCAYQPSGEADVVP